MTLSAPAAGPAAAPLRVAVVGTRAVLGTQGGIETYCRTVYPLLAEHGVETTVFVRPRYADPVSLYRGVALVPVWAPRARWAETPVHTALAVLAARRHHADIVHFHAIGPSLLAPLARALGLAVVIRHVGADYEREKWGTVAAGVLRLGERLGMRFADQVVCITDGIAEHVRTRYGREVTVIPNAVPTPARDAGTGTPRSLGLEPGRYVLTVGRLVPEKRHDLLVSAHGALAASGWKLVIAGGGDPSSRYVRRLLHEAHAAEGVVAPGYIHGQPLHELYHHAGLFVLPSSHEGLSFAALEALAYGLPMLVSDIPGNRTLGLSDECYVAAGDVAALAERLGELVDAPERREVLREASRSAAERVRVEVVAAQTLAALEAARGAVPR